jgi:hypothetical protein
VDTYPGKGWSWRHRDGIDYLVLEALEQTGLVRHGFSARDGGVSQGSFASLNLGLHVQDDPELVLENRQRWAAVLEVPFEKMVIPSQVHSNKIVVVGPEHAGFGVRDLNSAVQEADALVTRESGLPLCTFYADCVPVYFLDPVRSAIGLAHAGWKGTALKIVAGTLERMNQVFGTDPKECLVGIGPSIGPCCYEVDRPVIEKITAVYPADKVFTYLSSQDINREEQPLETGCRGNLNLWQANRLALKEAGVRSENIWIAGICTRCHNHRFFFHFEAKMGGLPEGWPL